MNGFKEPELDDGAFGAKAGSIVSAFDVFRMSNPSTSLPSGDAPPSKEKHSLSRLLLTSPQPRRSPST